MNICEIVARGCLICHVTADLLLLVFTDLRGQFFSLVWLVAIPTMCVLAISDVSTTVNNIILHRIWMSIILYFVMFLNITETYDLVRPYERICSRTMMRKCCYLYLLLGYWLPWESSVRMVVEVLIVGMLYLLILAKARIIRDNVSIPVQTEPEVQTVEDIISSSQDMSDRLDEHDNADAMHQEWLDEVENMMTSSQEQNHESGEEVKEFDHVISVREREHINELHYCISDVYDVTPHW